MPILNFAAADIASASSPVGAEPILTHSPTPTPTNSAPIRSGERVVGYPRPNGVKALKYRIKQRKSASGNDGICNKLLSKHLKADYVAGGIENKSRDRRRDIEPVVQQQCQTQHTTLGDTGKRVNIVKPKGEYSAAEQCKCAAFGF